MSAPSARPSRSHNGCPRLIYSVLIVFAVYYLLPLYVMLVNSLKPLDEIPSGQHAGAAQSVDDRTVAFRLVDGADRRAPTGLKPYFMNSILMVVPAGRDLHHRSAR
jgi:glucose/mannose transport system permease protein